MCRNTWNGEHEWFEIDDLAHPDAPDDDDSRIIVWECAACGKRTRTEAWEGPPA